MDKHTVLIVEDEIVIARDIKRTLERSGYSVSGSSATGDGAIKKAELLKPDIVLMDIVLKGKMDGIEAAKEIGIRYDIPVVFLTSHDDEHLLNSAKTAEPFGYLLKPFNDRELRATIEIALHKHKSERLLKEERDNNSGLVKKLQDALNKIKSLQSRTEDQLKSSIMEKEMLIREIHHRVGNNLQIITGLLRLQYKCLKDNGYMEAFRTTQNRIRAIALAYEKLFRSDKHGVIDFIDYLGTLAKGLFSYYVTDSSRIILEIEGSKAPMGIDSVIPCGLIVNEIITNSLIHAFPDDRKGEVRLSVTLRDEDVYELIISDNGIGIPKEADIHECESLGLQLITGFVEDQLEGELEIIREEGTKYKISFKELTYGKRV